MNRVKILLAVTTYTLLIVLSMYFGGPLLSYIQSPGIPADLWMSRGIAAYFLILTSGFLYTIMRLQNEKDVFFSLLVTTFSAFGVLCSVYIGSLYLSKHDFTGIPLDSLFGWGSSIFFLIYFLASIYAITTQERGT